MHDVSFCILSCQSFELGFLFSLFLNDHFEFEHGVSFRIFSYYVLYARTTIIISINIKTYDNIQKFQASKPHLL